MSWPLWVTEPCNNVLVLFIVLRTLCRTEIMFSQKQKWTRYILLGNQYKNARIVITLYGAVRNWDMPRQ